jgi:beta-lactamase class A
MIKVPLVAAALLLRALGDISGEPVPVAAANLTPNDGPSPLVEGYPARFEELCELAITRSDNVATNQLYDVVGRERATRIVRAQLGLQDTGFRRKLSGTNPLVRDPEQTGRNTFPAADAARLLRAIAHRSFAGADVLFSLLERQEWNTKLSTGLRPDDRFAHKTGDTETVSHDGGILETADGKRYAIVVYSGCPSSDATDARFGAFMRELRTILP